ncbi:MULTISPECIES: LysR family transcriptional regulator [unclassified Herbaspirillum]|uniref:LysR family transcriptional regulator n=1 Tax=unclassified Herbaspirillum TaxID=2624150 RepID=UPI0011511E69|nr:MULTISPECIES: LysR family transcriptional regulator [unclassified Herbaspirillum]MBB5391016.1 DNA-binding transcriptional LysR family regulator [Herbaspirillum sp. SJZ102]TQK13284.1 LysR family transcriptional regulator [Herbaspirillum sp. SJZ130]TQK15288.1 LysR family transcriptional regulator [Herbaspirillum sp. SJZ106]TWC62597.1 LysR family transcriptional regulator [Herbaspirillum sp. SJZ099]
MDLNQLEAFAAVMTIGSVTGAGRSLGRSQPAVSKAIGDLEAELGYALFDRNGPRVTPTGKAFLLYEEVERSLVGLRSIRERAAEIGREEAQPVHLVATPALASTIAPAALQLVAQGSSAFPEHIHLRSASAEQVVHSVLHRTVSLGLTSLPVAHRGLDLHWIGEAPCVAVMRADHPLARKDKITRAALRGERVITMSNRYRLRQRIETALGEDSLLDVAIDTNTSFNAIMAARAGLGVALVEPITALGMPIEGLVARPLAVDIPFYFGVVTPFGKPVEGITQALIGAVETAARNILHGFVKRDAAEHDELL